MNWPLLAAGSVVLFGSGFHGVVGDRLVRRVDPSWLGGRARFLIRMAWHFTTIAFAVLGIALVAVGVEPGLAVSQGVAYTSAALISCWAVFGLIASFARGGLRAWTKHPAPLILSLSSALVWVGIARL